MFKSILLQFLSSLNNNILSLFKVFLFKSNQVHFYSKILTSIKKTLFFSNSFVLKYFKALICCIIEVHFPYKVRYFSNMFSETCREQCKYPDNQLPDAVKNKPLVCSKQRVQHELWWFSFLFYQNIANCFFVFFIYKYSFTRKQIYNTKYISRM